MNPMFPLLTPQSVQDLYPAWPDHAEVTHLWHTEGHQVYVAEIECYDTAAELGAARDLEEWGCNPFEED